MYFIEIAHFIKNKTHKKQKNKTMEPDPNFKQILWDPMPRKVFNHLDSIDTELAWELCRTDIISQLLGRDAAGIPFLDEADVFRPFSVIGKVENFAGKKCLQYLGQLKDLVRPTQNMAQFYQDQKRVDDSVITGGDADSRIEQDYYYRVSNMKGNLKKGIKVRIQGCKAYDVTMRFKVGELRLDYEKHPRLRDENIQKIFIVYQTFYSEKISVSVTIGETQSGGRFLEVENKKFAHEKNFPIAFTCHRFPVNEEGVIGNRLSSVGDSLTMAPWVRCGISTVKELPEVGRDTQASKLIGAIPSGNASPSK